jgi:hypothetical protein
MQTCCRSIVDRIIRDHGAPHARLTLRTITESSEANARQLIADIILAISDIIVIRLHPRWPGLGLSGSRRLIKSIWRRLEGSRRRLLGHDRCGAPWQSWCA